MLLMLSLDSENNAWLQEHLQNGNLPNLAALAKSGVTLPVATLPLAGVPYRTMYCGQRPADLGIYFPIQWDAAHQELIPWYEIPTPETIYERAERSGRRVVVLDPPESPPVHLKQGFAVSGVQFRARVLLHNWSSDEARFHQLMGRLTSRLGPAPRADEIFGAPSARDLRYLRSALLQAPARLEAAALEILKQDSPDCLSLTFCGMHVAAHQFYHLPFIRDPKERKLLEGTRLAVAQGYDRLIGSIMGVLPPGSLVFAGYAKGMANISSYEDMLPEMLRRVLGQRDRNAPVSLVRGLIPRSVRRWVASKWSDDRALRTMARLSAPQVDWDRTRAFCLPTDFPGFIRFNIRGRERLGIVKEREIQELREEITAGLSTFTCLAGEPCVEQMIPATELFGTGEHIDRFPDLIVTWRQGSKEGVHSPKFGTVRRSGEVVGRSGNHAPGAFGILTGAQADRIPRDRPIEIVDFAPTLLDGLGLPADNLPGRSLWRLQGTSAASPTQLRSRG